MSKEYQRTFRRLVVWQKAKELTLKIYQLTKKFPSEEKYGLTSDIRHAAQSVMSNIAEGNERNGIRDKLHFFNIAYSSLVEVDNHAELAYALGLISEEEFNHLIELINKTAYLLSHLSDSKKNPNPPSSRNAPNNSNQKGFTLTELIVVVAIIALLTVGGVVGYRGIIDSVKVRQAKGVIQDVIKRSELEILKGDYQKSTLNFYRDYLIIVSEPEEKSLEIRVTDCLTGDGQELTYVSGGNLSKRDADGGLIEIVTVGAGESSECIDFSASEETETSYQLTQGDEKSEAIRFVHFNRNREKLDNPVAITAGAGGWIAIEAPYAKKTLSADDLNLTLSDETGENTEEITF